MSVRYSKYLPAAILLSDLLLLNFAISVAGYIKPELYVSENHLVTILLINLVWIFTSAVSGSFFVKRPLSLTDNLNKFILSLIYHLLIVISTLYLFRLYDFSRFVLLAGYTIFFLCVLVSRSVLFFLLDYIRKNGYNHRRITVVGDKNIADRLLKSFKFHPEYGYDLCSFISDQKLKLLSEDEFCDELLIGEPDEIFICYKDVNGEFVEKISKFGEQRGIKVKVVSDLVLNRNVARLINYDKLPVLQIESQAQIPKKILVIKRGFDLAFSVSIMVAGLPVFVVIYAITKMSSKGPVFFKQQRVGRYEKPFNIYKFRSMYVDAEKNGPQLAFDGDPRITKWGKIIRRTRLDELPQFWNVLKGEMSIVGPRPERQHYIEKIIEATPDYKKLLHIKPGITSIGQVHYGYAEDVSQMCTRVRYDMVYLKNVNINSDINIIFKTVGVMIKGKGK